MIGPLVVAASLIAAAVDRHGALFAPREVEFPFDDARRLLPTERRAGKLWRSRGLPYDGRPVPLVIFVHGIIFDGQRHHWLTPDRAGPWDARPFLDALVDEGEVAPLVAAVPSQTRDATDPGKLFVDLDFDAFVATVDDALAPWQRVDRERIVVVGHSASACDPRSGALRVMGAKSFRARALLALDGCLAPFGARALATTVGPHDVVVGYQDRVWPERPFAEFRATWAVALEHAWPKGERILERVVLESENAHLEIVEVEARRWLPIFLPPIDGRAWTAVIERRERERIASLPVLDFAL